MLPEFKSSKDLKLEEEDNFIKVIRTTKIEGSAVSESIFNNSLVYSLTCEFNTIISKEYRILIGLIPAFEIPYRFVGYPYYATCYNSDS